jgi:hypothetical protein
MARNQPRPKKPNRMARRRALQEVYRLTHEQQERGARSDPDGTTPPRQPPSGPPSILGGDNPPPDPLSGEDPPGYKLPQPWYEGTLLWGALTTGIAIVLVVVAAMVKDLRWLLWVSWPFFALASWSVCKGIHNRFGRSVAIITASVAVGVGLFYGYHKLSPQQAVQVTVQRVPSASEIVDELSRRLPTIITPHPQPPLPSTPPFSVDMETGIMGINRASISPFWLVFRCWAGVVRSPSNAAIVLRITNLLSRPSILRRLSIEINSKGWRRALRFDTRAGRLVGVGADLSKGVLIKDEQDLIKTIDDKEIEPFHTVKGWVLFQYPEEGIGPLRVVLEDTLGAAMTANLKPKAGVDSLLGGRMDKDGIIDLTSIKVMLYSDVMRHSPQQVEKEPQSPESTINDHSTQPPSPE